MTTLHALRHAGLTVTLASAVPLSEWEEIEDIVAHALHLAGYAGRVFDDLTANTTAIRDLSSDSSAVKEVDWTRHERALFCPACGDTLFCNRCGRESRALNASIANNETPLGEALDDHPVEGIDD